ncbi:MAG: hypothetical protein ACR2O5_02065 [Thiogranum sp.]
MAIKSLSTLFIVFAFLFQSGCATVSDAKADRGTGEVRVYPRSKDLVWDVLLDVLGTTDLKIVSTDKDEGVVLAKRGMTGFSYGEKVAIFVEELNEGASTRVELVNKRVVSTNNTAADWATIIFNRLDKVLM